MEEPQGKYLLKRHNILLGSIAAFAGATARRSTQQQSLPLVERSKLSPLGFTYLNGGLAKFQLHIL